MKIYLNSAVLVEANNTSLTDEKEHYLFDVITEGHERRSITQLRCNVDDPNIEILLNALKDGSTLMVFFALA